MVTWRWYCQALRNLFLFLISTGRMAVPITLIMQVFNCSDWWITRPSVFKPGTVHLDSESNSRLPELTLPEAWIVANPVSLNAATARDLHIMVLTIRNNGWDASSPSDWESQKCRMAWLLISFHQANNFDNAVWLQRTCVGTDERNTKPWRSIEYTLILRSCDDSGDCSVLAADTPHQHPWVWKMLSDKGDSRKSVGDKSIVGHPSVLNHSIVLSICDEGTDGTYLGTFLFKYIEMSQKPIRANAAQIADLKGLLEVEKVDPCRSFISEQYLVLNVHVDWKLLNQVDVCLVISHRSSLLLCNELESCECDPLMLSNFGKYPAATPPKPTQLWRGLQRDTDFPTISILTVLLGRKESKILLPTWRS